MVWYRSKKLDSLVYRGRYQRDGRTIYIPLVNCHDEDAARAELDEKIREVVAPAIVRDVQVAWHQQRAAEIAGGQREDITISQAAERYEARLAASPKCSPGSRRDRVRRIRLFAEWWTASRRQADRTMASVTPEDAGDYLKELTCGRRRLKTIIGRTVNDHLSELTKAWQMLAPIALNHWKSMERLPKGSSRGDRLSPQEEDVLVDLAAAQGPDWSVLVLLGLDCGMDVQDAMEAKWNDIHGDCPPHGMICYKRGKMRHRDDRGHAQAPVSKRLSDALGRLEKTDIHILPAIRKLYFSDAGHWPYVRRWKPMISKAVGDPGASGQHKDAASRHRFKTLRHTCISRLYEKGLSAEDIRTIAGQHDPDMYRHYLHADAKAFSRRLLASATDARSQVLAVIDMVTSDMDDRECRLAIKRLLGLAEEAPARKARAHRLSKADSRRGPIPQATVTERDED